MAHREARHAAASRWSGRAGLTAGAIIAATGIMIGAMAAIPDAGGVIHGCYAPKSGYKLRVIDTAKTTKCPSGQVALNWNQQGVPGSRGPQGPAGEITQTFQAGPFVAPSGTYGDMTPGFDFTGGKVQTVYGEWTLVGTCSWRIVLDTKDIADGFWSGSTPRVFDFTAPSTVADPESHELIPQVESDNPPATACTASITIYVVTFN